MCVFSNEHYLQKPRRDNKDDDEDDELFLWYGWLTKGV